MSVAAVAFEGPASSALSRLLDGLKAICALVPTVSSHLLQSHHPHDELFL